MRNELCAALLERASSPNLVFLTGDLGFMTFEPLADALGERFINAGVAEQNMISVAAALAHQGFETWVYSIAPFCYARPFEQVRNDVALHDLPVKIVGNGGGYGYGVMGPTHHGIEDYGVLSTLPNVRIFTPVFEGDISEVVGRAAQASSPSYVRLGRGEQPPVFSVPAYAPWRQLTAGGGPAVVAVGALASAYVGAFEAVPQDRRPNLWAVAELPLSQNAPPAELLAQIASGAALAVAEEHVRAGSFGADFALYLAQAGAVPRVFRHFCARAHESGVHGSQAFLRRRSGLDAASLIAALDTLMLEAQA